MVKVSVPGWTRAVFLAIEWLWWGAGTGCLVFALALFLRPARLDVLEARLTKLSDLPAAALLGLFPPFVVLAFKLAQLHAHQLMGDSGTILNVVWNAGHGFGLASSVMGCSYYGVHFSPILALMAPILRVFETPVTLLAVHAAAVGSLPAAAYVIGRALSEQRWVAWAAALLTLGSPLFHDLAGSFLDSAIFAAPLFFWAAALWLRGRMLVAGALGVLLLTTKEQAPFLIAGWGLLRVAQGSRTQGTVLVLAAVAGWLGEFAVIRAARVEALMDDYWLLLYPQFGGTPANVGRTVLLRPWAIPLALIWPPVKLLAPLRVLAGLGFLPLFSGAWFFPAAAAWLPQQLAAEGAHFHQITGHYAAMVAGPLALAAAAGLAKLARAWAKHLAAAWVLAGAGLGFLSSAEFLPVASRLPEIWREEVPAALAQVPAGASVWADEFLLPRLALRRNLKALHLRPEAVFDAGLFVPDRVVYSRSWTRRAEPAWRDRMFRYLESRGFAPVFEGVDLVVLADPATRGREGGPAEPLRLP